MNYRELIVKNHQLMSYNKIFANIQPGQDIFWPGCAVLSHGREITEKTYLLLKKKIPGLVYSTYCCGKPSKHINNGKDYIKIENTLHKLFKENKVKKIYTLCPNCLVTLSEYEEINVQSAWALIDEIFPQEKHDILKGECYSIHDPCPIVHDIEAADHVRNILNKLGIEVLEFKNNKEKTICCGKKNMLMALNPEKGKKLFELRASQAPSNKIVTYCASCRDTFKQNSYDSKHILELLFETEASSSWVNRFRAVSFIKKEQDNA